MCHLGFIITHNNNQKIYTNVTYVISLFLTSDFFFNLRTEDFKILQEVQKEGWGIPPLEILKHDYQVV